MIVKELKEALNKWPDEATVTVMVGEDEELAVVEVNEPMPRVNGPVIWAAKS